MLIEQPEEHKPVKTAGGRPLKEQKHMKTSWLFNNEKSKNMYNQLEGAIRQAKTQRNAKGVLIGNLKAKKHAQPAKGRPINLQKRWALLKVCLLTEKRTCAISYTTAKTAGKKQRKGKGVLIEQP